MVRPRAVRCVVLQQITVHAHGSVDAAMESRQSGLVRKKILAEAFSTKVDIRRTRRMA